MGTARLGLVLGVLTSMMVRTAWQAGPAVGQDSSGEQGTEKAKQKGKQKASTPEPTTPGSSLGPGAWLGLVKDPPTTEQLVLAYHPQLTQGLPSPEGSLPTPTKAAGVAKQKARLAQQLKEGWKLMRFSVPEATPIRFSVLPEAFDDKGEILKPTTAQAQQMKQGGIPGKMAQMRPGMLVRVTQTKSGQGLAVDKVEVLREMELPGLNGKASKTPPKGKG